MTDQELLQTIAQAAREGWEELDLTDQQLTTLPAEIGQLTQLKVLKLGTKVPPWEKDNPMKNQLTALPSELFTLTNLTTLWLWNNKLTALPSELFTLTNLTELDLSDNQLTALPPELFTLTNLTTLYLGGNQLTMLPPKLFTLTNLTVLSLRDTQLTALPPELFTMTNLTYLNLSYNGLTALPPEIGNLTNLTMLAFSGNQLTALPPELFMLTNLTELELEVNKLTSLPPELFTLTNLTELYLSGNQLTALPAEIGKLTNLTAVALIHNQLTTLPPELAQLTKLENLWVDGNPLKSPPPEIVEQGTQAILAYLREQAQGCSLQWLSKMVIVGEGGVGKTSLLRALRGEPYIEGLDTTRGITIETLDLPHPQEQGVTMQLNAWDFGGQEIYHATHQFFLTNRALFLLLWNARHGYEQGKLYYWLDQLQARAPESPVLLVATHIDEREPDLPLAELQAKYPQIVGSWGLSNKTGAGLAVLRAALADAAAELPLMGEKWPTNWLNAAEAIRARGEKHITPQQLAEVMAAQQVAKSSQAVLARWLHELGDILYFQGDEELSDLVILKPQWVTAYLYKVLDCEDVINKEGVFTREQKQALWGDLDPELHEHFLRLMEKFDLSYRTLENREISLVVERLPLDPPDYTKQWTAITQQTPCREIAMRFKLNTLPAGIPTWFIARSHRFTTHTHWRSGAVFGDDPQAPRHLALVQAFSHHRYLQLTVRGPNPHNFFALLKDGLEVTLARFPGLQIERKMPCPGHDGQPCDYEFDYHHLQARIERVPPKLEIECPAGMENVSVAALLFGLHWKMQDAVLERIDALDSSMSGQHAAMLQEVQDLRALTQREFTNAFRREQALSESHCPNVFVLSPYHAGQTQKALIGQKLYLKLYCQAPGHWHPTQEGGLYELDQPAAWLQAVAPYVRKLVKFLKYVKPLAGPWLALALPEYEKMFKNELDLMNTLIEKLPEDQEERALMMAERVGERFAERIEGAALRALRKLLDEKDPAQQWGGLKKTLTPEGHYLWLCAQHAREYAI